MLPEEYRVDGHVEADDYPGHLEVLQGGAELRDQRLVLPQLRVCHKESEDGGRQVSRDYQA